MRAPGAGTVTELGPSRFWARGPRPDRIPLGVYPTREEAEDVANAAVQELARADRTRLPGATVRAFGSRWLDEWALEHPRSERAGRLNWRRICATAPWIDDPLETLRAPQIDRWAKALARTQPGSAKLIFGTLRQLLGAAAAEGLIPANPAASIRLRAQARTHDPWTYLTLAEQRALLTCPAANEDELLLLAFALGTGLRAGELVNLRLVDLHVGDRPRVVVRYGSRSAAPKGRKIRSVPLFGLALAAARRWTVLLPTFAPANPRGLAFPGPAGGFRGVGHVLRIGRDGGKVDRFQELLTAAGIVAAGRHDGRAVRWHDLRHSFAASLVSGWWGDVWRIEDLRDVMGHSTIAVTQRYAHLAPERVLDLAARTPGLPLGDGPAPLYAIGPAIEAAPAAPAIAGPAPSTTSEPGAIKYKF